MELKKELRLLEKSILRERLKFVEKWAVYVRENPEDAFKQHTQFINEGMKKMQEKYKNITPAEYLKMKELGLELSTCNRY